MAQPNWITAAGSIGVYPVSINIDFQFEALPVSPATSLTYSLLSGIIPDGCTLDEFGLLSGSPAIIITDQEYQFVVRVRDNLGNIADRTFTMKVLGVVAPEFTTPSGSLFTINDSIWKEYQVQYSNPVPDNIVSIRLLQGTLPPGLEINELGLIRGYAQAPVVTVNLGLVTTTATATMMTTNLITCLSTEGFEVGRPVIFGGGVIGGLTSGVTYYIKEIINLTQFSVSTTINGPTYVLSDDDGIMTVTLPNVSVGEPTIRTFSFTLKLESALGNDLQTYFITIKNQNTPSSQGGDGKPQNTRVPVIFNTRPPTYNIETSNNYRYYILPEGGIITGATYDPDEYAYIGKFYSNNYFAFKVLGHDFDNNTLSYNFSNLPLGLVGDTTTGWITGTPSIAADSISQFNFSVSVYKSEFPLIQGEVYNFEFRLTNGIDGVIVWDSPADLGTLSNNQLSLKRVEASCDVELFYRLTEDSGPLPPNLTLLSNGEITGRVAFQPENFITELNDINTFTFTVEAYSNDYPLIKSTKTFTLNILQENFQPLDTLYIKCTPSIEDRLVIDSLLTNDDLIPYDYLYRPEDENFGKSTFVSYVHAYGIFASNLDEYLAAITKNHYWKYLTLGAIETAVAKDENNEVIYEVVYSRIIDNLVKYSPEQDGFAKDYLSISKEVIWPFPIDLALGPWYTSSTTIFTSYIDNQPSYLHTQYNVEVETQSLNPILLQQGSPLFYTSLTPGYVLNLYPNSLPNMRKQVGDVLGQNYDANILPLWMTSQQPDGNTLGFTPAWVICYTKPGYAAQIKNNIETEWLDPVDNNYKLNTINFRIDRFTVDKSMTYNYENTLIPPAWTGLPSATPQPDPIDSQDFYVLFPHKTILPNDPQVY
jgi:hypothetical protein